MTEMLQKDWKKEYQFAGSFQTALMRAIELADTRNLDKLQREFPDIVLAFREYSGN